MAGSSNPVCSTSGNPICSHNHSSAFWELTLADNRVICHAAAVLSKFLLSGLGSSTLDGGGGTHCDE